MHVVFWRDPKILAHDVHIPPASPEQIPLLYRGGPTGAVHEINRLHRIIDRVAPGQAGARLLVEGRYLPRRVSLCFQGALSWIRRVDEWSALVHLTDQGRPRRWQVPAVHFTRRSITVRRSRRKVWVSRGRPGGR